MQRNWIGRSEGLEIQFRVEGEDEPLTVFTTRPDTLMGVTFLVDRRRASARAEGRRSRSGTGRAFIERMPPRRHRPRPNIETQEKSGIDTGLRAIHPVTGEELPIWIANFVLMGYGTGAVMAVPGHDQRDWEFATEVRPADPAWWSSATRCAMRSREIGRDAAQVQRSDAARRSASSGAIDVYDTGAAVQVVRGIRAPHRRGGRVHRVRLAGEFRRIRRHGFPRCVRCAGRRVSKPTAAARAASTSACATGACAASATGAARSRSSTARKCGAVPVPEDQLPVVLPEDVPTLPAGVCIRRSSPIPEWRKTTCPQCGGPAERETDTFDTFMESSWYYARYTSPGAKDMVDARANYWLPVDQYIGGIEHAILHLLYFRFYPQAAARRRPGAFATSRRPTCCARAW